MLLRAIFGCAFIIGIGVAFGILLPTIYAIPASIAICVLFSYAVCHWIMEGTKQTLVELIFLLPVRITPIRLRIWAIFTDRYLK